MTRAIQNKQISAETESRITHYIERKEYVQAARLADRSGNAELRDQICEERIIRCNACLYELGDKKKGLLGHMSMMAKASIYREMSELYGVKKDQEQEEECMKLSRSFHAAYIEIAMLKRSR